MLTIRSARLSAILTTLTLLGALSACNTIEGAGEDLEAAGDAVEETTDAAVE